MARDQLNRLELLPYEIIQHILSFIPIGACRRAANFNTSFHDIIEARLIKDGKLKEQLSYAYCVDNDKATEMFSSVRQTTHRLYCIWQGNNYSIFLREVRLHDLASIANYLLQICASDDNVAFDRLLSPQLSAITIDYGSSAAEANRPLKQLKNFLFSPVNEEFMWTCVLYPTGRELLNQCVRYKDYRDWWRGVPSSLTEPRGIQGRAMTALCLSGLDFEVVKEAMSRSENLDQVPSLQNMSEPKHVITAVLDRFDHDEAEALVCWAIERGAPMDGVSFPHRLQALETLTRVDSQEQYKLWCISTTPIFMAVCKLAHQGVHWPVELCLEYGASINQEKLVVFRMQNRGFSNKMREAVVLTPSLVYLLSVPWWRADFSTVLQDLQWLLDRGANFTKKTYSDCIGTDGKWNLEKSTLSSQLAKRPVWCYSPVDLLLCLRLPSGRSYSHVLYYPPVFGVVRALIDMGCHEPMDLDHRYIYRKICKERGLSCSEPVAIGTEDGLEELARGFGLI